MSTQHRWREREQSAFMSGWRAAKCTPAHTHACSESLSQWKCIRSACQNPRWRLKKKTTKKTLHNRGRLYKTLECSLWAKVTHLSGNPPKGGWSGRADRTTLAPLCPRPSGWANRSSEQPGEQTKTNWCNAKGRKHGDKGTKSVRVMSHCGWRQLPNSGQVDSHSFQQINIGPRLTQWNGVCCR